MIYIENKKIVVPGEEIAEGDYIPDIGCHKVEKKIVSNVIGIVYILRKRIKVVPFQGKYLPKIGDPVIGVVGNEIPKGWILDINSPYIAILDSRDIFVPKYKPLRIGDVVYGKIERVSEVYDTYLMAKRPYGRVDNGILVEIHPSRVPRLIGKKGSMINTIKEKTKSTIIVGQNGYILVRGGKYELAVEAIRMVDEEAHTSGLTDRISEFLDR